MVSWQRNLIYFRGRPIAPLLFWGFMIFLGGLGIYLSILLNNDLLLMGGAILVVIISVLFLAGSFYICLYGKNDYGDVNDLI